MQLALHMFKRAVEIDPAFTLAYARLSEVHSNMYWHYYDHSDQRLTLAKEAVDKAFELNPDLPEVRLALGHYYYHCHLDYDRALEQFDIARMRAIEQRRYLVRASTAGPSAVIDPWGRVQVATEPLTRASVLGEIRPRTDRSVYGHVGDLFAVTCLLAVVIVLLALRPDRAKGPS